MGRKSQAEKAESRAKIVESAARMIREKGIEQTGVADIMGQAGLTHGGFYRHFDSKEALISEAIDFAFGAGLNTFADDAPATFEEARKYVEQYLSQEHVQGMGKGCPIPLVGAEVARGSEAWRAALAKGIDTAVTKLSEGLALENRSDAVLLLSSLVGTLVIARGVGPGPLQEEFLEAAKAMAAKLCAIDGS